MAQRWKQAGSLASGGLRLNMFTQDEMDAIHRATLEILETTGVLIGSPEARELLVQAGASVYDEDLVRIPQWLVAEAVASAPEVLTLPGRTPDRDVMMDGRRVVFTNFGNVLSMGMAGGSTPVNLAGALVVHNCEALAGLVLSQVTRKGAKFIYGSSSTAMDLRYGAAVVGTPELAMLNAGVACMARYYKLPSWAAGG